MSRPTLIAPIPDLCPRHGVVADRVHVAEDGHISVECPLCRAGRPDITPKPEPQEKPHANQTFHSR